MGRMVNLLPFFAHRSFSLLLRSSSGSFGRPITIGWCFVQALFAGGSALLYSPARCRDYFGVRWVPLLFPRGSALSRACSLWAKTMRASKTLLQARIPFQNPSFSSRGGKSTLSWLVRESAKCTGLSIPQRSLYRPGPLVGSSVGRAVLLGWRGTQAPTPRGGVGEPSSCGMYRG